VAVLHDVVAARAGLDARAAVAREAHRVVGHAL
jgi:hypothetical protein